MKLKDNIADILLCTISGVKHDRYNENMPYTHVSNMHRIHRMEAHQFACTFLKSSDFVVDVTRNDTANSSKLETLWVRCEGLIIPTGTSCSILSVSRTFNLYRTRSAGWTLGKHIENYKKN